MNSLDGSKYRAHLHWECLKNHGHKGAPRVTPMICGAVGERDQVILMCVRAPDIGNASYLRRLGVMEVRP